MRTTLDIDGEVLRAVKEIARREARTAGAVLSDLARRALTQSAPAPQPGSEPTSFFGFRPLVAEGRGVSNQRVFHYVAHTVRPCTAIDR